MMELIHMTAAYSNAVLVAVLPYVSDFAKRLDLPIQHPVTTNQVIWSHPSPYKGWIEGGLVLTNHDWFGVSARGFVNGYRAPTNVFYEQEMTDDRIPRYFGHDHMTTNEAVEMARGVVSRLGWKAEMVHTAGTPSIRGPYDWNKTGRPTGHVPYCQVTWDWPKGEDDLRMQNTLQVEINLETKQLVGFTLILSPTNVFTTKPIKVGMVPELESEWRKQTGATNKMFINTNAPKHFPKAAN